MFSVIRVLPVVCLLALVPTVFAQEKDNVPSLITPLPVGDERAEDFKLREGPTIARSGFVLLNTDILTRYVTDRAADVPEDAAMKLQLFDDVQFTLVPETIDVSGGVVTVRGHELNDRDNRGYVVVNDSRITADVIMNGAQFQIRSLEGLVQSVVQINQSGFAPEAEPTVPNLNKSEDVAPVAPTGEPPVIDVLVAYTDTVAAPLGDIEGEVRIAIQETNDGYASSGIVQRLRLVGTMKVSYDETGDIEKDRDRLQDPSDGYLDEVPAMRDKLLADVVSLWVEHTAGDVCGISYIMDPVTPAFAPYAYSVVKRDCATGYYSFGHELGHIMSARHDWYMDPTDGGPFSYDHGFTIPSKGWRTIMAYNASCAAVNVTCTRILYWSNPDVTRDGVALGAPEGQPNAADNRKTLNATGPTVAAFR